MEFYRDLTTTIQWQALVREAEAVQNLRHSLIHLFLLRGSRRFHRRIGDTRVCRTRTNPQLKASLLVICTIQMNAKRMARRSIAGDSMEKLDPADHLHRMFGGD